MILLDEQPHLEQRKLLLPAFHGERMQQLSGLMEELAEEELASWPCEQTIELHPRFQRLTLEIILRAVFGLERGAQLEQLRDLLGEVLAFSQNPLSMLPRPPRWLTIRGPIARRDRLLASVDEMIFDLIAERRRAGSEGEDVLALTHTPPRRAKAAYAHLVHHDPTIYPEPQAFRPERFLDQTPGTYTWIPFGGGRRRCLGASFALLEMKLVIRAMLRRFKLEPPQARGEKTRRRNITVSPGRGCQLILHERVRDAHHAQESLSVA